MGGREMEERGKLWVEYGCHLEGWVAEGRENKSWSCGAAPVALKTDRDERSSSPVSVSSCRIDRAVVLPLLKSTEAIRSIRSNGLIEPIRSSNKSRSSYTIAM